MKVACLVSDWVFKHEFVRKFPFFKKERKPTSGPKKDEIVTVVDEIWDEGEKYYKLLEWPDGKYRAKNFRPIDEGQSQYKEVGFTEIKKKTPVPSTN